ncbi:MAG: putative Ig domain-containing protein [Gemmataceae bacterium]|nr:putative Ig domain-containing protein [Gemmataceae bacterium]
MLATSGNQTVDEETLLSFTAAATDPDIPANTLTFSLDAGAPAGASIDAATGVFTWTPTEAQRPGSYPITVRVSDNGTPKLFDEETITVTVNEANVALVLAAIGNRSGTVGASITFTATATDADVPANSLTFTLDPGALAGATIHPTTGLFSFTPTTAGTFPVTVRVTDSGGLSNIDTAVINVSDDDSTGPTILLGGSSGTETDGQDQQFTWDVSDVSGLSTIDVTITKVGFGVLASFATASGSYDFNQAGPGTYTLTVGALDNDGDRSGDQSSSTAERSVIVTDDDTTAPAITLGGSQGVEDESLTHRQHRPRRQRGGPARRAGRMDLRGRLRRARLPPRSGRRFERSGAAQRRHDPGRRSPRRPHWR